MVRGSVTYILSLEDPLLYYTDEDLHLIKITLQGVSRTYR